MEPRARCRRACAPRAAAARDASVDAPRGRRDALALALSTACAAAALGAPRAARAYGTGGWKDCAPICDELKNGKADQDRLMAEIDGDVADGDGAAEERLGVGETSGGFERTVGS